MFAIYLNYSESAMSQLSAKICLFKFTVVLFWCSTLNPDIVSNPLPLLLKSLFKQAELFDLIKNREQFESRQVIQM